MRLSISQALIAINLVFSSPLLALNTNDAEACFHEGAKWYIFGTNQLAKAAVEAGLRIEPENQKLKELEKLLKKEEQQNQQSKDDQKDQPKPDKSKQDQPSKDDQQKKDEQKKGEQQKPEPEKKPEDKQAQQKPESPKDDQKQAQEQKAKESKEKNPENGQDAQAQPTKGMMVQMTPQEAQRLLDSQKNEEKTMIFVPKVKTNRTDRVFKDW